MTKITKTSKTSLFILMMLCAFIANAQVGIGTTTPDSGALLDLDDPNRGLLVPRVTIGDLTTAAPVTAPTTGLLVWNVDAGTGVGFHYWDGNDWIPIGGSATGNYWDLAGNAITGTEFLGTTNNNHLDIRTNNLERMRVEDDGQVTVGYGATLNPNAGFMLTSFGAVAGNTAAAGFSFDGGTAFFAQETGFGFAIDSQVVDGAFYGNGTVVRARNFGGSDLVGPGGVGVYAENFYSNNYSIHAVDGTTSVYGDNTFGLIGVSGTHFANGIGVRAENFLGTNYSLYALDGLFSVYGDNNLGNDAVVGDTNSTVSNGIWGRNPNAAGTAILGGVNGLNIYPTTGAGVSGSGPTMGIYGYAGEGDDTVANQGNAAGTFTLDSDSDVTTTTAATGTRASAQLAGYDNVSPDGTLTADEIYYGGYFTGGTAGISYAYAGIKYNPSNASGGGGGGTNYKIIGNGTNSTIIRDSNNTPRILFSPEAPEILFEDYGTGKLTNGTANIIIDPIFKDAIHVDENHPLKVFIQLEGDCNGVYVTNKSANGFTVKELQSGNSNVEFSWHIVANRADEFDENGDLASEHVSLRFPIGPGPIKPKVLASKKEIFDLANVPVNQKAQSKVKPERIRIPKKQKAQSQSEEDKELALKKAKIENLKKE